MKYKIMLTKCTLHDKENLNGGHVLNLSNSSDSRRVKVRFILLDSTPGTVHMTLRNLESHNDTSL